MQYSTKGLSFLIESHPGISASYVVSCAVSYPVSDAGRATIHSQNGVLPTAGSLTDPDGTLNVYNTEMTTAHAKVLA